MSTPPICPHCQQPAVLRRPDERFPHRWECVSCDARVGCHPKSTRPLGTLANAELRNVRMRAHKAFDALWKRKMRIEQCTQGAARSAGYRWLATQMDMTKQTCHIAMFDKAQCERAIAICAKWLNPKAARNPQHSSHPEQTHDGRTDS